MKTKRTLGWSICLCLLAAGLAQTTGDAGWVKYSSDEGKFSALFPAQPQVSSTNSDKGVVIHIAQLTQRPRAYMVLYSVYPPADLKLEMSYRLKAERDGFINGINGGQLVSEREFKFKRGSTDLPALEFTAEDRVGVYKCVVVIDGELVYLAGVGSAKGADSTVEIARFLGAFTLN